MFTSFMWHVLKSWKLPEKLLCHMKDKKTPLAKWQRRTEQVLNNFYFFFHLFPGEPRKSLEKETKHLLNINLSRLILYYNFKKLRKLFYAFHIFDFHNLEKHMKETDENQRVVHPGEGSFFSCFLHYRPAYTNSTPTHGFNVGTAVISLVLSLVSAREVPSAERQLKARKLCPVLVLLCSGFPALWSHHQSPFRNTCTRP